MFNDETAQALPASLGRACFFHFKEKGGFLDGA
jgi:hypothetical protein